MGFNLLAYLNLVQEYLLATGKGHMSDQQVIEITAEWQTWSNKRKSMEDTAVRGRLAIVKG